VPIFGGSKRPPLDGLTQDEAKRRDSLNAEVIRRAGEKGVAGQVAAALAVLREKHAETPGDFLWALLLGRQLMGARRFAPAIEAFSAAVAADEEDVRARFGAGMAFFEAAEAKLSHGAATTADVAPPEMTVDNLYHESLRHFRRALELTSDSAERNTLREAASTVEKAIARKAGRL
jgi:tetratricopeptide (TPR) repeat protein